VCTNCPYCHGSGLVKTHESIAIEIERALKKIINHGQQFALKLIVHPQLAHYLEENDAEFLANFAESLNARLDFETDDELHINEYKFVSSINLKPIEV